MITKTLTKKNTSSKQKNFFQVQVRRLATSFDASTRFVTRTSEIFLRKATCVEALFFFENPRKQPDAKVLRTCSYLMLHNIKIPNLVPYDLDRLFKLKTH